MKENGVIRKSFVFFRDVKFQLIILTLLYAILGGIGFVIPILTANLVSSITEVVVKKVLIFAVGLLAVRTTETLLWFVVLAFWKKHIRTKLLFNIRKEIVDNILELKILNFDKYSTGMFQERVKNDPNTIARVVNAGQRYLISCLSKIGVIIYVLCINWILGAIYIFGVILVTMIDTYTQNKSKEKNKVVKQTDEKVNSVLSEIIRGIRDIKLLDFKSSIKQLSMDSLEENNNSIVNKDMFDSKMQRVKEIILFLTVGAVVILGIYFVDLGIITASALITLYLYNSDIFSLMDNFSKLRSCLKEYELAVERLFDLKDNTKFPKDTYGNIKVKSFTGKVEFDNVTFAYNKKKNVLENLSLKIEPKQMVALVGASGSGKTTIFNLLTKSYDAISGQVRLDDVDINRLDEKTIRKNISIITQSPYIFNMSIKDNLRLVKPKATNKEIEKVCKDACFYDFVMTLPDKFDTIIGEGGVNLSGGQKQRLAIARALLKDCKIMLFDEATSALDNVTQQEIQESINNISNDYTIIIVAHRLSTIKDCNTIYLLDSGKIIDSGTHTELLNRNKEYKKLYNAENVV